VSPDTEYHEEAEELQEKEMMIPSQDITLRSLCKLFAVSQRFLLFLIALSSDLSVPQAHDLTGPCSPSSLFSPAAIPPIQVNVHVMRRLQAFGDMPLLKVN
jgi:hypothetical protein